MIGNHSVWFNERLCTSPEQVVAECIQLTTRRLANQPDSARAAAKMAIANSSAVSVPMTPVTIDSKKVISSCPECRSVQIEYAGGCYTCRDCGFSKIGRAHV